MTPADSAPPIPRISTFSEISDRYDAILCDIWGVVHNGVSAFPPASEALSAYRRRGGVVVLVTNAPRPSAPIRSQLHHLGVSPDAFDAIATSGDVAIHLIAERIDEPVLHIGPGRDLSLFEGAAAETGRAPKLVALENAAYALCTGLRDDTVETPPDYDAELRALAGRGLPFICANPDIVIHRGETMIYCAGAIAQSYEALGGAVVYAGKPYAPIYARALSLADKAAGRPLDRRRVLAVGDGMKTDIAGAVRAGLDSLLVTHGIHRDHLHAGAFDAPPDPARFAELCAEYGFRPTAAIASL